jgi:hypothetical protein
MENTIWSWLMPSICITTAFALGMVVGIPIRWKSESSGVYVKPLVVCLLMFESIAFGSCLTKSMSIYGNFPEDLFWYLGAGACAMVMVFTIPRNGLCEQFSGP